MIDDLRAPLLLVIAGIAVGPATASARPASWPSTADAQVMRDGSAVQVTRTMSLDLPADADTAFPLFGPVDEAKWAEGWSPHFIAPQPGAQTPDGAVFTTGDGENVDTWIMTDFDPAARTVRYVHLRPGRVVAQLWIAVTPVSAHASRAEVTYRYTTLGPGGRDGMDHFIEAFPNFKQHWETHIGAALTGRPAGHHHP